MSDVSSPSNPTFAVQKISFAEEVKPSSLNQQGNKDISTMSNRKLSSSSNEENRMRRLSTHSSIPEDAILDERGHKQDWTKTTAEKDTWAWQERRRQMGWSNTDVASHQQHSGRRGSVLSMWAPGKDVNGKDVLMHNDDNEEAISDSGRSDSRRGSSAGVGGKDTLMPGSPRDSVRRASNLSEPRRGSILSLWKGGKDAKGNDIMGGDDEEWAR